MSVPEERVQTARRPLARLGPDSVVAARAMVDAIRLSSQLRSDNAILSGILDGLATLVRHDAAGVFITDTDGKKIRYSMVRGCDTPPPQIEAPFAGKGIIGDVIASGQPRAITADDSPEASEGRACARSRLVVPIISGRSGVLGALEVWSDHDEGYDELATELVAVYALAVAGTIEGARMTAAMVDKDRIDTDLALAREVMADLLPHVTPALPGFDIAGAHQSSLAVGGDYYEFIPLEDDRWAIVVADVVGKGVAAALLVSAIRASISAMAGHELAARAIMRRANRFFHESVEEGRYVTLFYAVLDVPHRRMIYVNAGHVPPILMRANGEVDLLEEGGVPIGMFESPRYFEGHAALESGDLLALYTDGIVEAMDENDHEFGHDRLIQQLRDVQDSSATEICSTLMRAVRHFGAPTGQDDRTILIIRAD